MEWFEGLDPAALEQVTNKGWNKPAADVIGDIYKAHAAAQSFIGSDPDRRLILPKDATDPSYASILDRVRGMSLPASIEGYTFDDVKFKDGTAPGAEDQAFVREFASKNKLSAEAARGLLAAMVQRADAAVEADTAAEATATAARDAALRGAWAANYDGNAAKVAQVADALKGLGIPVPTNLAAEDHVKMNAALLSLQATLAETPILAGTGASTAPDPTRGMTQEAATARFNELKQSKDWIDKALYQPASPEAKEWFVLSALMAGLDRASIASVAQSRGITL